MSISPTATGYRVSTLIRLYPAERDRLLGGVFRVGSRSVLFRFPDIVEEGVGDFLGAVIESLRETAEGLLVELWFWDDIAAIYVTPGVAFEVWYLRTSGDGIVLPWAAQDESVETLVEVTIDSQLISEALVLWTGWHIKSWPQRDDQRVIDRYGQDAALDLLPVIHRLEEEFYESDARDFAPTLVEMGNQAEERFRSLHPELTEEAIGALGWCYTFDYK